MMSNGFKNDSRQEKVPHPWYVTGLINGDGCFSLFVRADKKSRRGRITTYYYWVTDFAILLMDRDLEILQTVKRYFGCGGVSNAKLPNREGGRQGEIIYKVRSRKDILDKVIPHFDSYPLLGRKSRDYELWKEAVLILTNADSRRESTFEGNKLLMGENKRLEEIRNSLMIRGFPRKYRLHHVLAPG
jgi:hypothetical protein